MKKVLCMVLAFVVASVFAIGCAPKGRAGEDAPEEEVPKEIVMNVPEESVERILNPDIGFYRTLKVKLTEDGGTYTGMYNDFMLHHLRVDIGAFSANAEGDADKPISQAALDKLDELLGLMEEYGKNAIIRFAYDGFVGRGDKEPSVEMMLNHIASLSTVIEKHTAAVTAVEIGMVGKYGELHSSTTATNPEVVSKLIDAFLDGVSVPILVRTPGRIYDYLGITVNDIDTYTIKKTDKAYRLGMFNDGYLGSLSDLGTYKKRAQEVEWMSAQTEHLPYGGEVVVGDSDGDRMSSIENALPEMNKLHLSYLNYEWNYNITQDKWVNETYTAEIGDHAAYYGQTAQRYIENHMGYRFVLNSIVFAKTSNTVKVKLGMENVGFGNLFNPAHAAIILEDEHGKKVVTPAPKFFGQSEYEATVNTSELSGNIKVYLRIAKTPNGKYPIAFANVGVYDETLGANFLGMFDKDA